MICDNCRAKMVLNKKENRWECLICGNAVEGDTKMKRIIRPNYCKHPKCNKIIRNGKQNKSGLCNHHSRIAYQKSKYLKTKKTLKNTRGD